MTGDKLFIIYLSYQFGDGRSLEKLTKLFRRQLFEGRVTLSAG